MKGKLADAMLSGTPSITTSIGAESMYGELEWPGVIKDDDKGFSNAAIDLYDNHDKWEQCQLNGIAIVNEVFNKEINERNFLNKLFSILKSLDEQRNNNFTGMMLRHHKMKSTMYMSQWIEAKNKLEKN